MELQELELQALSCRVCFLLPYLMQSAEGRFMLYNLKVFLGPAVALHCKSQRLSMPRAEFSNVCHTLAQIKLRWLKIWAGESQRVLAKE